MDLLINGSGKMKTNDFAIFGANRVYVEELYENFLENQASVDGSWCDFFNSFHDNLGNVKKLNEGAPWRKNAKVTWYEEPVNQNKDKAPKAVSNVDIVALKASLMIEAYRERGHLLADLDPLGLAVREDDTKYNLDVASFGITADEMNIKINVAGYQQITISELINTLKFIYSNKMAVEFAHCDFETREWLYQNFEQKCVFSKLSSEVRKQVFECIHQVEAFEDFAHIKFPGTKRFSVEGAETSVAATEQVVEASAEFGVKRVVVGMAHRGRLSTLTKIMGKPYAAMFSEFVGKFAHPEEMDIMGDVKYHLGCSLDVTAKCGNMVHLSMVPNPSHLETVNPVVAGKVRAEQDMIGDNDRSQVLGLLLHGDAAFMGQGVVAECLNMSGLDGYTVGGIIHLVVNNQIGFTTDPIKSRTSRYATDVAKIVGAPVIHVNADDADAVAKVTRFAVEYRQKFKRDVVIDIVGYRKYGHNEGDEPMFTQPIMYKKIAQMQTVPQKYLQTLIAENVITQEEYENIKTSYKNFLEKEFEASKEYKVTKAEWLKGNWSKMKPAKKDRAIEITGVAVKKLKEIGLKLSSIPSDFNINSKITRQFDAKQKMMETGKNLDWSMGEALAYGSLMLEGYKVRLSGQDAGRGTFSHRHSVLTDQETQNKYVPFNNIKEGQASYEVVDSCLSEYSVLGFEYGYSITDPKALTIWEAQFGDFSNGCQIIIDQYVSSAETKWLRMSGLVMLLPHGMEGQGPEHSSARLERYLQLCADDNMQVVNCTTPASFFHVMRRQMIRDFRKPLIVMTPKSLLRHRLAVSDLSEFDKDTHFKPVIGDNIVKADKVTKVVMCSGKIYYDLLEEREKTGKNDVALVRLEQLYPFPYKDLAAELAKYKNAEFVWCQEEPENMGAYHFVALKIHKVLEEIKAKNMLPICVSRKESPSPACGYKKTHDREQQEILDNIFKF
jgi:2-oxoglutarate dehydrogenase E1 component